MSTDTQWALTVEGKIDEQTDKKITEYIQNAGDSDWIDLWREYLNDNHQWEERNLYDHSDFLFDLSKAFPKVVFKLECNSCFADNVGVDFWKNGKVSFQFPDWAEVHRYSPKKLKPYKKEGK